MEPIIEYVKRNLREAGAARWPAIAAQLTSEGAKTSEHLMRKIAYGDRDNPTVDKVQPLLDFFHAVERGERELPPPVAPASAKAPEAA